MAEGGPIYESTQHNPRIFVGNSIPGVASMLSYIRTDRTGGQPLRDTMITLGKEMGQAAQVFCEGMIKKNGLVVGIPRGGVPMSQGVYTQFSDYTYVLADMGERKNYDQLYESNNPIIIVDGVIVSGSTMNTLLYALSSNKKNRTVLAFAAVALRQGIDFLLTRHPNLYLIVGEIEEHSKTFWDPHFWKLRTTIDGIGNIGELVSR